MEPSAAPTAESDVELYLRRAAEVEAIAARLQFELDREPLLKIAADWRRLAENARRRAGALPRDA